MSLPFGHLAWNPHQLMHLGQKLPMMLTSFPNHGSKNSKSSFSLSRSHFGSLIFGSKGNHFHSRMLTTCARPKFSSFLAISFNFKGAKKSQMQLYKLQKRTSHQSICFPSSTIITSMNFFVTQVALLSFNQIVYSNAIMHVAYLPLNCTTFQPSFCTIAYFGESLMHMSATSSCLQFHGMVIPMLGRRNILPTIFLVREISCPYTTELIFLRVYRMLPYSHSFTNGQLGVN